MVSVMSGRIIEDNSDDSDEDFGPRPGGTAKLSTLFATDKKLPETSGFTYRPPKPPNEVKIERDEVKLSLVVSPTVNFTPSLIYASTVSAYFQRDDKFAKQGKLGCALVRSAVKQCHLLLYLDKQQPLVQLVIDDQFKFTIDQSYAQFVDLKGVKWSISFNSEDSLLKFVKWILAVQISFSADPTVSTGLKIDVKVGEGNTVRLGDAVEIEFSECLVESGPKLKEVNGNDNFGQLLRLKVGKGKVPKGWESGLIGMAKNGLRVFVVSSVDLGNSPMLVTVNLKRIKFAKSPEPVHLIQHREGEPIEPDVVVPKENVIQLDEHEESVVVAESTTGEYSLKSRMARLGQSVLKPPLIGAKPNQMAVFCATVTVPSNVTTTVEPHKSSIPTEMAVAGSSHSIMSTSTSTSPIPVGPNAFPPTFQPYSIPPNFYYPPWMYPPPPQQPFSAESQYGGATTSSSDHSLLLKELRESQALLQTSIVSQITAGLNKLTEEVLTGVDRKLSFSDNVKMISGIDQLQSDLNDVKSHLTVSPTGDLLGKVVGNVSVKLDSLVESAKLFSEQRLGDKLTQVGLQLSQLPSEAKTASRAVVSADQPEELRVRRILNGFYKRLSGHLAPDQLYSAEEIRQITIAAIKESTTSAFQPAQELAVQTDPDSDVFQSGLEKISSQLVTESLQEYLKLT